MTVKTQVKHLKDLSASNGWQIVQETMESEIKDLALRMARSPEMTQQQMDFQRGAIYAADQLLNLPSNLILKLEGEITLEETMRQGPSTENENGY